MERAPPEQRKVPGSSPAHPGSSPAHPGSGRVPGLQVRSLAEGMREATGQCFSHPCFPPSFSLNISKILEKNYRSIPLGNIDVKTVKEILDIKSMY